jgi:FtsH-binding integral membrane protein
MITLYCYRRKARTVPTNYILLSAFTLAEAYLISATTSFYDQETIVIAFLITFLLVSILTLISCFGKFVITQKLNLLIFLPIALIVLIIYRIYFQSRIVRIIISLLIIFMYSVFIVYDLQRMTGKKANGYNVDDYIIASLDLYIDIILVF